MIDLESLRYPVGRYDRPLSPLDKTQRALLIDAIRRTLTASETLGIRAMLIHALSEDARAFYERYQFVRSPADDMMLMATLSDLRKALS